MRQAILPIVQLVPGFHGVRQLRHAMEVAEAGYRLLRFTASDVLASPASVVAQVSRALGTSGYSSSSG